MVSIQAPGYSLHYCFGVPAMAMTAIQLVLYENDAVEADFVDGAKLFLSPCGTLFVYRQPVTAGDHPVHG